MGTTQRIPFECHNETYNFEGGNLIPLNWHIHYVKFNNRDGFYNFCMAFEEKFAHYFDPQSESPRCPFGPNYVGNTYEYICSFDHGSSDYCTNFVEKSNPWNDPNRAFHIPVEMIEETWEWAKNNKYGMDLFRHPNTGCMQDDHKVRGVWAKSSETEHSISYLDFPCNQPNSGCDDYALPGPSCGCQMPLISDKLEDSCQNCEAQYIPPTPTLKPGCTKNPLQVNYKHVHYYSGKVECGNLFLEADIGGGIDIPPSVVYPYV